MRTDLKKCARIFLTKQLEVTREAQLEMRGEVHSKISEEEEDYPGLGEKKILSQHYLNWLKRTGQDHGY